MKEETPEQLMGYSVRECEDRFHHVFLFPGKVVVDAYKTGESVVLVERDGRQIVIELTNQPKGVSEPASVPSERAASSDPVTELSDCSALLVWASWCVSMSPTAKAEVIEVSERLDRLSSQLAALIAENAKLTRERDALIKQWVSNEPGTSGRVLRGAADAIARVCESAHSSKPPSCHVEELGAQRDALQWQVNADTECIERIRGEAMKLESERDQLRAERESLKWQINSDTECIDRIRDAAIKLEVERATLIAAMVVKDAALRKTLELLRKSGSVLQFDLNEVLANALSSTPASDLIDRIEDAAKALEKVLNGDWHETGIRAVLAGLQPWRPKA